MVPDCGQLASDLGAPRVAKVHPPAHSILARLDEFDRCRLSRILSEPMEYLSDASFAKAQTAKELFGDDVGSERAIRPWCNAAEAHLLHSDTILHKTTLTSAQETRLFLRLNYSRYRMARLLDAFSGKRLTARATQELLFWHGQSAIARDEIVQANLPLVLAMAKRTKMGNVDYAELISEGNMALLRSVDKFDCGRGFKFSTYACRAILKSFSRVAMRTSRYRGRFPTDFDPAMEKSDYREQVREDVEASCVEELRGILRKNAADLNEMEVKVLQARFALNQISAEGQNPEPKTLEQVGLMIGVTKERVRQIQNRALAKLREKLQEDFLAA
jgi:RNA polymerase sigma factor (sigma-70 family)